MIPTDQRPQHRAGAWQVIGAALAVLLLGVAVRFISPAIFLDIASLWPIGAVLLAAGWVVKAIWSYQPISDAPIFALLVFSWLVISTSFYFADLPGLPSSSADLRGPPAVSGHLNTFTVEMTEGSLTLGQGTSASAYQVDMPRRGGGAGIPVALESFEEEGGEIRVIDAREPLPSDLNLSVQDNGWLRFQGWEVGLHTEPTWDLTLSAPAITADLQTLKIAALQATGGGTIRMGEAAGPVEISVAGSFTLEVPEQAAVEVLGAAIVPEEWTVDEDMAWFGEPGAGWHIMVAEGGSVQILTFTE